MFNFITEEDIKNVTKQNFIELQEKLCFDTKLINAHNEWEKIDQEWKDLKKQEDISDDALLSASSKVRSSKEYKDSLYDEAALLAERLSNSLGIIERYEKDTLGDAKIVDEVVEGSLEWLNLRRHGVGGSSIMEALGFHWKSRPGDPVYMKTEEKIMHWQKMGIEKSTEIIEKEDDLSGVLFRGHKWEPSLIARYAIENNVRVGMSKATWRGKHPLQIVNVDGIILDDKGNPKGIVECKTSSREWTWQWGVPMHYRAQVLWYLESFGLDYADVIVKFDTGFIETFRINRGETIDGSSRTQPIMDYISELEENWNKYVQPYKDNPDKVWDVDAPYAERYAKMDDIIPDVDANNNLIDILEVSDIIQVKIISPYERMPKKYDIVSGFESTLTDGMITIDSISPAYYPVDTDYIFSDPIPREDFQLDDYVNTEIVLAVDQMTYDYLVKVNKWFNVVNASDLRRLIDMKPGWKDFKSVDDTIEWINNYMSQ